jgi:hypothetical protein
MKLNGVRKKIKRAVDYGKGSAKSETFPTAKPPNQSINPTTTMSQPLELNQFAQLLQTDPAVIEALAKHDNPSFDEFLASSQLEDLVKNHSIEVDTIEAAGGCEHYFNIEIKAFGPVYWIQASEFDDIGYFGSEKEAVEHAREEYGTYIETLEELQSETYEDEEEEEE